METDYRSPTELQAQALGIGNNDLATLREQLEAVAAALQKLQAEVREARKEYQQRRAAAQGLRIEPDTDEEERNQ